MKKPLIPGRGEARPALLGGTYSIILTAVVLALLIVVNVLVSVLPTGYTMYDISSSKLYSVTSNTKVVLNALEQDVTIYWVVQSGEEDSIIENLLGRYESLSEHISVVKRNPDVYPTFTGQYTDEAVQNNSLVVESGERSRYISYNDIYVMETDIYSYSYTTSFDGEGAITSAIDYVVNADQPVIYALEGHGESALPDTFSEQLEKENMELESFSLLNTDEIPEDASCLLLHAPQSDISEEERDMLADYISGGGKLLVIAGPVEDSKLENLYGLLENYGVSVSEGIVIEGDREHYAFSSPFILMPDMNGSGITDALMEERYYPIMPIAAGLTVNGEGSSGATVTELLTTSDSAYSKTTGYELTTYEREEGDVDGPFALAVSIEDAGGGELVWFSSSAFLDDMYNAYSSGANVNLAVNAVSSMVGESEAMSIRSKSLNYSYLTISDSVSSLLKVLMIGVFPLAFLALGICVVVKRRGMLK